VVELRADPWRPDFGAGAEIGFDEEISQAAVDTAVETTDWSRGVVVAPCEPEPFVFVDGVMRSELRVMASDGDKRAWGLVGSFAAGAVTCNGSASFSAEDTPVGRVMLLGSRVESPGIDLTIGRAALSYRYQGVTDDSPTGLRRQLQRLMLSAEQQLAARMSDQALVFADGPLHMDAGAAKARVVGVVKRMVRSYLPDEEAKLLPKLRAGERSPVFGLGNQVLDRFAWYIRLIDSAAAWHELAGLVRCEVRMELGLEEATKIADLVTCHLPTYAGRPGVDPRAPQNLTPVGALEERLKHRLGSALLISRALLTRIARDAA
jgi:uncharacterized protein